MEVDNRGLNELASVGPMTMRDFKLLGVNSVAQLKRRSPERMYRQLCRLKGPQDICCLDVFTAAVAQAKDPDLPIEERQWWYWSKKRKAPNGKA
jgi:pathogenicity locus Cdd1 protein